MRSFKNVGNIVKCPDNRIIIIHFGNIFPVMGIADFDSFPRQLFKRNPVFYNHFQISEKIRIPVKNNIFFQLERRHKGNQIHFRMRGIHRNKNFGLLHFLNQADQFAVCINFFNRHAVGINAVKISDDIIDFSGPFF